jgi:hypothetical protein
MNHRSGNQPWGSRWGKGKRMMPPRRKTTHEGVSIIGLQAGKRFRLSPRPRTTPPQQQTPTSRADGMEPQMVVATTPLKDRNQSSESTVGTHQQQRGGEAEGRHLPKLHNNASRERNDARKCRRCWPNIALDRAFLLVSVPEMASS